MSRLLWMVVGLFALSVGSAQAGVCTPADLTDCPSSITTGDVAFTNPTIHCVAGTVYNGAALTFDVCYPKCPPVGNCADSATQNAWLGGLPLVKTWPGAAFEPTNSLGFVGTNSAIGPLIASMVTGTAVYQALYTKASVAAFPKQLTDAKCLTFYIIAQQALGNYTATPGNPRDIRSYGCSAGGYVAAIDYLTLNSDFTQSCGGASASTAYTMTVLVTDSAPLDWAFGTPNVPAADGTGSVNNTYGRGSLPINDAFNNYCTSVGGGVQHCDTNNVICAHNTITDAVEHTLGCATPGQDTVSAAAACHCDGTTSCPIDTTSARDLSGCQAADAAIKFSPLLWALPSRPQSYGQWLHMDGGGGDSIRPPQNGEQARDLYAGVSGISGLTNFSPTYPFHYYSRTATDGTGAGGHCNASIGLFSTRSWSKMMLRTLQRTPIAPHLGGLGGAF